MGKSRGGKQNRSEQSGSEASSKRTTEGTVGQSFLRAVKGFFGQKPKQPTSANAPPTAAPVVDGPGTVRTPSVPTKKTAVTKASVAPVGASGRRAPAAIPNASSSAVPNAAPPATVHKVGQEAVGVKLPATPKTKAQSSRYLTKVQQCISQMEQEIEELAEPARRNVSNMEQKGVSPAQEIITLHAATVELLESLKDIPDRMTAQVETLKDFMKVYENLCDDIEEGHQKMDQMEARHIARTAALDEKIDRLQQEMDDLNDMTQRILLAESVYLLGELAEEHVYGSDSSGYQHKLSLMQLKNIYETRQLTAEQEHRWEQVVDCVGRCLTMQELLVVERKLRTERRGAAHGYDDEKRKVTLGELQQWACLHYSQEDFPNVHAPLIKMLDVLAGFSSDNNKPFQPVRSFESMLHPTLRQKS